MGSLIDECNHGDKGVVYLYSSQGNIDKRIWFNTIFSPKRVPIFA